MLLFAALTQNTTTLQLSRGLPLGNSPGSKQGANVVVERVHIYGLSRFRNLGKFAHSVKVKVLPIDSNARLPNIEVCFHRWVSALVPASSIGHMCGLSLSSTLHLIEYLVLMNIYFIGGVASSYRICEWAWWTILNSREEHCFTYLVMHGAKVLLFCFITVIDLSHFYVLFRNASLAVGMCPHGQWEKVAKGSWDRSMSPFDHKILDIRTAGSTLENFEVSVEEGKCSYVHFCFCLFWAR